MVVSSYNRELPFPAGFSKSEQMNFLIEWHQPANYVSSDKAPESDLEGITLQEVPNGDENVSFL